MRVVGRAVVRAREAARLTIVENCMFIDLWKMSRMIENIVGSPVYCFICIELRDECVDEGLNSRHPNDSYIDIAVCTFLSLCKAPYVYFQPPVYYNSAEYI